MPKKPKLKSRVWHHPSAIEAEYVRAAQRFVKQITAATNELIVPQIPHLVHEAGLWRPDSAFTDDDELAAAAEGTYYAQLTRAVDALLKAVDRHSRNLWSLAKHFGAKTQAFNDKQFHASVRSGLGVDVFKSEPWLAGEMKTWEAENLRLIKSIPAKHAERLQGTISQALRQGQSTAEIVKAVKAVSTVTKAQAELIAADQIGKLNAGMTQARQTAIGVKEYRWRGVLDRRERDLHRRREGQVFAFSKPPSDGNPGFPIRCRCWPEAIFPELKDIDGAIVP